MAECGRMIVAGSRRLLPILLGIPLVLGGGKPPEPDPLRELLRAVAAKLDHGEPAVRAAAVSALGQVASRLEGDALGEICKSVEDALDDKEAKVRCAAVATIVQCAARLKALGAYPDSRPSGTKP